MCPTFFSRFGGLILEIYSGVGFGACERLLEQLSSEHQTDANPQFDIPVESKDVPDERPQWSGLTLIMVCRNMQKAEAARGKLLSYLDQILKARTANGAPDEYGQNFRENLVIEIEKCDFTSVKSVVDCARGMRLKSALRHFSSCFSSGVNGFFLRIQIPILEPSRVERGDCVFRRHRLVQTRSPDDPTPNCHPHGGNVHHSTHRGNVR